MTTSILEWMEYILLTLFFVVEDGDGFLTVLLVTAAAAEAPGPGVVQCGLLLPHTDKGPDHLILRSTALALLVRA